MLPPSSEGRAGRRSAGSRCRRSRTVTSQDGSSTQLGESDWRRCSSWPSAPACATPPIRAWRDHLIALEHQLGCKGGCAIGTLAAELAEVSTSYRDDLARGFRQWESAICDGVRAMHARGELRADADPDELAMALLAAVEGGLVLTQLRRDTAPLKAALDCMISYLESLTPSPKRPEPSRRRRAVTAPSD